MENTKIIDFNGDVEVSEGLDDGLYQFKYLSFERGNHEGDQRDPDSYPTVIAKMELTNSKGETFERNETFKLKDTKYNRTKLARFFLSMNCPKNLNGSVKMAWTTAVGKLGWIELATQKIGKGADESTWQRPTFVLPEELDKAKAKAEALQASTTQFTANPAPLVQAYQQPTQQPTPQTTWNGGNGGMSW